MTINVLCHGYKDPQPEKIKDLLMFEKDYLQRQHPNKSKLNIYIFSVFVIKATEEINETTVQKARKKADEEYNPDYKDLGTVASCHGVQRFTFEI